MPRPDSKKETVYGRYSLGSGRVLEDPYSLWKAIDDPGAIESYEKSIRTDLDKSGISLEALHTFDVMDVGTGRQGIVFHRLGARRVNHYDLSPQNVQRMKFWIKRNNLQRTITSACVDLVKDPLPRERFDLVYLNGVVQHFSDVSAGLLNCMRATKKNGYVWLYFYRSGTFLNFVLYMIRDLIRSRPDVDLEEYFVCATLLFSETVRPDLFVSDLMDDFFVGHINLYTPQTYIAFVNECGFEVVSSSKLDPYGKDVDHKFAGPSVVLTCRRMRLMELPGNVDTRRLSPGASVNQLDSHLYSSQEILDTIAHYEKLRKAVVAKQVPASVVLAVAFRIYRFLHATVSSGLQGEHAQLQKILGGAEEMVKTEF